MKITLGFTGSRSGQNYQQLTAMRNFIYYNQKHFKLAVHGGCIGSDTQFHNFCHGLGIPLLVRWGKSAKDGNTDFHSKTLLEPYDEVEPETYFARNREIVEQCDLIIGTPHDGPLGTGGTWYTLDYAKRIKRAYVIFFRNGLCEVSRQKSLPDELNF